MNDKSTKKPAAKPKGDCESSKSSRSDVLALLSKDILPDEARARLNKLADEMDELLFLDETDELAVDRKTLIRLANDEDLVPKSLRDVVLVETSKYLGRRVKERGKGRRISWRDGHKYGLPGRPLSESELHAWGITDRTSTDELAAILKSRFRIPAFWMNDNPRQLGDEIVKRFQANRTVWDCVVANLGFWAALTLGGGLVVFVILALSGVPWPWALLVDGIYQTGATLAVLLNCVANPNFQA